MHRSAGQDLLKWLALFFMVVDHLRFITPLLDWTVYPGRLAMPFFCLSIAFNVARLRPEDISFSACRRYIGWMALFAVISQPFFFFGVAHTPFELNIFFVLLPALLLALGLRSKSRSAGVMVFIALALTATTNPLWGWHPVAVLLPALMVAMLRSAHGWPRVRWILISCAAAALANVGMVLDAPAGALDDSEMLRAAVIAAFAGAAPWIGLRVAERRWGDIPRVGMWAYGFYPAHFLVIGVLAMLAGR